MYIVFTNVKSAYFVYYDAQKAMNLCIMMYDNP